MLNQRPRFCSFLTAFLQANAFILENSWSFFPSQWEKKTERKTNIFRAERKEERREMERGWVLCCAGEAAKIHYLSVLYLFHMLLLSNLSLQILNSENKQRDQSSRSLQANVPLQTPQRRTAAALPAGRRQKCRETRAGRMIDGWTAEWMVLDYQKSSWRNLRTEDRVANSTFCSVGSSALAPASLILSAFTPHTTISPPPFHCSPFFRRIGVYSRQSTPVQEVEREGLSEMRDHGRTSEGENRITAIRFKWGSLGFMTPRVRACW